MSTLTAAVLTLNEAEHLPDCLASLTWADVVLVLDSGSTDPTVDIARAAGVQVITHPFENYARQRQRALDLVSTPWVLFVDADERVPPELAEEVRAVISQADPWPATTSPSGPSPAGYWIPRRNIFWGRAMRGGGWWPDHQLRLLRVDRARFDPEQAVHEVARVDGPTGRLTQPLSHLNYADLAEFRTKQAAYARFEAERRRTTGQVVRPHNLVLQPWREFRRRYVALEGWRDGLNGLVVCALMAWYELRVLVALRRGG